MEVHVLAKHLGSQSTEHSVDILNNDIKMKEGESSSQIRGTRPQVSLKMFNNLVHALDKKRKPEKSC